MTTIRDILPDSGTVWAKTEWTWRWGDEKEVPPCIAYGNVTLREAAARKAKRGDLVLMIRVLNREHSKGKPGWIEGVVSLVPSERRPSDAYVSAEVLKKDREQRGREWLFAIGCSHAWQIPDNRNAEDVCPLTRRSFARMSGESALYPINGAELEAVLALSVVEIAMAAHPTAAAVLRASPARQRAGGRLAPLLYKERRAKGFLPNESQREVNARSDTGRVEDRDDAIAALARQSDLCALCGGEFGAGPLALIPLVADDGVSIVHAACRELEVLGADTAYPEGGLQITLRDVANVTRAPEVRPLALAMNLRQHAGRLVCKVCSQDWLEHPGVAFTKIHRLFEVHHLRTIADGPRFTNALSDTVVLCALCHRLSHTKP